MNAQAGIANQTFVEDRAHAVIPPSQQFLWSLRRELWENRYLYLAPLAVAMLFLIGYLISLIRPAPGLQDAFFIFNSAQPAAIQQPYNLAAMLIMATTFLLTFFYSLDALYGERRDRSILFWKSLPVSDLITVLSKATIAIVFLPLLTFAITVATQAIMLLLSAIVLPARGLDFGLVWSHLPLGQMTIMLLYHLLAIHALWYAPIYAYLLLVSSWARRVPILWASLPLLAIGVVEKIAFNTTHFANLIGNRISGGPGEAGFPPAPMTMDTAIPMTMDTITATPIVTPIATARRRHIQPNRPRGRSCG